MVKQTTTENVDFRTTYSISDIFSNRFFEIPDFQRGYSWDIKQLNDLKEDIIYVSDKNFGHYTGTIVVSPVESKINTFEVVDGQQRMISLVLLIAAICNHSGEESKDLIHTFLYRGQMGKEQLVLKPNTETLKSFESIIFDNDFSFLTEIKSQFLLKQAYEFFIAWLKKNEIEIDNLILTITKKLRFLIYQPEIDPKEIGIMFEVINNRGKKLSQLEKVKNYFIYYSTVHDLDRIRRIINQKWESILRYLNISGKIEIEDEDAFLRNCYLVAIDPDKEKSRNTYEMLKEKFSSKVVPDEEMQRNLVDFLFFMEKCAKYYAFFHNESCLKNEFEGGKEDKKKLNIQLQYLRSQFSFASVMPLYLAIMSRMDDSPKEVLGLLKLLEIFNFRYYILPEVNKRTDSGQATIFYLANFFYNHPSWDNNNVLKPKISFCKDESSQGGNIFKLIENEMLGAIRDKCPQKVFINALVLDEDETFDYYKWRTGLRYFLGNYEIWLQEKNNTSMFFNIQNVMPKNERDDAEDYHENDVLSVEHIWAQKNRKEDFPGDHIEKRRLGNLVLMGLKLNQEQSDNDIPKKIEDLAKRLEQGKTFMIQVSQLRNYLKDATRDFEEHGKGKRKQKYYWRDLSSKINDLRENDMIKFALHRWQIPGENPDVDFTIDSFNKEEKGKYLKL